MLKTWAHPDTALLSGRKASAIPALHITNDTQKSTYSRLWSLFSSSLRVLFSSFRRLISLAAKRQEENCYFGCCTEQGCSPHSLSLILLEIQRAATPSSAASCVVSRSDFSIPPLFHHSLPPPHHQTPPEHAGIGVAPMQISKRGTT